MFLRELGRRLSETVSTFTRRKDGAQDDGTKDRTFVNDVRIIDTVPSSEQRVAFNQMKARGMYFVSDGRLFRQHSDKRSTVI